LVYHQNVDGTSTITLTPALPLSTDIYLIAANGLTDIAGNALTGSSGVGTPFYTSFDLHASPASSTPLAVVAVSADQGAVAIKNDSIPQPDTIGIQFNKPVDLWTINTGTVHLYAQAASGGTTVVPAAVAYSPTTSTAYLTPQAALTPGTIYYVAVDPSVSDDQSFPNPDTSAGGTLGAEFTTSFTVSGTGVAGHGPLTVTQTAPANGTQDFQALGYGAVSFSEGLNTDLSQSVTGRFSAMLIPQTGGLTTGGSGYADVPLNAQLAFNPNTNQLIVVPTQPVANSVYLFSIGGIKASNADALTAGGGSLPFYSTFQLLAGGLPPAQRGGPGAPAPAGTIVTIPTNSTPPPAPTNAPMLTASSPPSQGSLASSTLDVGQLRAPRLASKLRGTRWRGRWSSYPSSNVGS
jgi:hypothetical protein